jgi:hypothetical protein
MTPKTLEQFRARMEWDRQQFAAELDISQDRLRRMLAGAVPIRRHIALACAALSYELTKATAAELGFKIPKPTARKPRT